MILILLYQLVFVTRVCYQNNNKSSNNHIAISVTHVAAQETDR